MSPKEQPVYVRSEALAMFEQRLGLTEQAVGERAYPGLTPESARQKYRRRKAKVRTEVSLEEARALARGLDAGPGPEWLDSVVVWTTVSAVERRRLVAPAGALITWGTRDAAGAACHVIGESELYPRPEPFAMSELEIRDSVEPRESEGPLEWVWYNADESEDVSIEELLWLLDVERVLRGLEPQSRGFEGWGPWFGSYLREIAWKTRRRAQHATTDDERAELSTRLGRFCDLIEEEVRLLRSPLDEPEPTALVIIDGPLSDAG